MIIVNNLISQDYNRCAICLDLSGRWQWGHGGRSETRGRGYSRIRPCHRGGQVRPGAWLLQDMTMPQGWAGETGGVATPGYDHATGAGRWDQGAWLLQDMTMPQGRAGESKGPGYSRIRPCHRCGQVRSGGAATPGWAGYKGGHGYSRIQPCQRAR
jgi:hypothetical protein